MTEILPLTPEKSFKYRFFLTWDIFFSISSAYPEYFPDSQPEFPTF